MASTVGWFSEIRQATAQRARAVAVNQAEHSMNLRAAA